MRLLFIVLFAVFYSCQSEKEGSHIFIKDDYTKILLSGKKITLENRNAVSVNCIGKKFLLFQNKGKTIAEIKKDSVFSLYKIKRDSLEYIASFGKYGTKIDDFEESITNFQSYEYNSKEELCIWVYETNKRRYRLINVFNTINDKKIAYEKSIQMDPRFGRIDRIIPIAKNYIVCNQNNLNVKMNRLVFGDYSKKGSVYKKVPLLPKILNRKKNNVAFTTYNYNYLFANLLLYNKEKKLLISPMVNLDRIDVFDINGKNKASIINSNNYFNDIKKIDYSKVLYSSQNNPYYLVSHPPKNTFNSF